MQMRLSGGHPKPGPSGFDEVVLIDPCVSQNSPQERNVKVGIRRIDSRLLLPSRRLLPHVNCYLAAERLQDGGGDGEATDDGDTPRA